MKKSKSRWMHSVVAGALILQGVSANAQSGASIRQAAKDAILPFHVHIPEKDLVDLKHRILATRWPEKETVDEWSSR